MAPEKAPAFQFYPREFLMDGNVAGMSLQERGAYITLICLCWQERTLPADVRRLARMVGLSRAAFARLWLALEPCFRASGDDPSRLIHPRLEKEREKQDAYRQRQSAAGKARSSQHAAGPQPDLSHGSANTQPNVKSPISDLRSPISDLERPPSARSRRPIFTGQRLTVFEWMLDDLTKLLGPHTDTFDLHEWFFTLDAQAQRANLVIPQRDGGAWLHARTLEEAQRRGLPIASTAPALGKQTTRLAAAVANIHAEAK